MYKQELEYIKYDISSISSTDKSKISNNQSSYWIVKVPPVHQNDD